MGSLLTFWALILMTSNMMRRRVDDGASCDAAAKGDYA